MPHTYTEETLIEQAEIQLLGCEALAGSAGTGECPGRAERILSLKEWEFGEADRQRDFEGELEEFWRSQKS